ncbi:MAG: phosphoglycerate mutase [Rhodoferax sp.]|nr:phosphoglycerate mutase [Rhodoferax sp.]
MHLVIPFAAAAGPQCQAALERLALPHLRTLLRTLRPSGALLGTEDDLSPLPERVLCQDAYPDGLIPWAALRAAALPLFKPSAAYGLVSPCHLVVHADHISMQDPASLDLSDADSQALMRAMQPYFLEDGLTLHWLDARTWLAEGEALRTLPTASLERVRGQSVDRWMPRQNAAKLLRRLQNEMQMLLYTHPINDARVARGAPMVNSFWLSGTGDLPPNPAPLLQATVLDALTAPALRDDALAWVQAWHALDAGPLAEMAVALKNNLAPGAAPITLTLCGSHRAQTWSQQPRSLWRLLLGTFNAPRPTSILKTL